MADGVGFVARDRLVARLDEAVQHRLTLVIADAGFGKTELLEQWLAKRDPLAAAVVRPSQRDANGIASGLVSALRQASPDDAARLALVVGSGLSSGDLERAEGLAGLLSSVLAGLPTFNAVIVLDDAHLLSEPTFRFVESLLRQAPPTLHLLLLGRTVPPLALDRLPDEIQRLGASELGFTDAELSELMIRVAGDDEHAPAVRALLGRWPAALRLAAERVARVPVDRRTSELLGMKTHGARDLIALANEVIRDESPRTRRLAQVVAPYDGFCVELAEHLGCDDAQATIDGLVSRGILMRLGVLDFQYYGFPRLLREFVRATMPIGDDERPALVCRAGGWFQDNNQPEGALRCAIDQQDSVWAAELLRAHGRPLIERGRDARVEKALSVVSADDRDAVIDEVEGALHDARGDHVRALHFYGLAAERRGRVSAWLAYRTGFLHYFRGNLDESLAAFRSGDVPEGSGEQALLQAWEATALWAQGEVDKSQDLALSALALAQRVDDPQALAASHTIMAMLCAHRGDRDGSQSHYDIALPNAEQANDVAQVVRIRNNRGASLLDEAELARALPELEVAIELAQASGLKFYLSAALVNRGQIRYEQGQYDAAVADLEKAHELDRTAGTSSSATRIYLGHVYRHRGYANAARVAYEEVLGIGRANSDATLIVPALCGLAQLLAETDPHRARVMSDEALSYDSGVDRVEALCTAGWVAQAQRRTEDALLYGELARVEAVSRRDRMGEAEALQLLAVSDPDLQPLDPRLEAAAQLMEDIGAPVWRARVKLEQARRLPAVQALPMIAEVQQLAAMLGARNLADKAAAVARAMDDSDRLPQIEIVTLGGFRVRRSGKALGLADWPDEDAASLLKRLTSVSSLSWTRGALRRSLWPALPAEDGDPLLDSAITAARTALDPEGRFGKEQFLREHGDLVILQSAEVDVHAFFEEAQQGLVSPDLRDLLRRAEARYSGDYLEEHPGEAWAMLLREEARGQYVSVAHALAKSAVREGEFDAAARYARRILERDPYDEGAHLALVTALTSAGNAAEARSCYATYVARVDELGLDATPWALVSTTPAG